MEKNITGMLALAGLFISQSAFSLPLMDRWGTGAHAVTRSCTDAACQNVDFNSYLHLDDEDNYHSKEASGLAGESEFFEGFGAADLEHTGDIALPHLRGLAYAESHRYAFGGSYGLEGFTYNGPEATISLDMTLRGTVLNLSGNKDSTYIHSSVYLFKDAEAFETVVQPGIVNINSLIGGLDFSEKHLRLEYNPSEWEGNPYDDPNFDDGDPISEISDTLDIDLSDGDTFYLYAYHSVKASGQGGQYASSLNSLELEFTTISGGAVTGLTASSVSAVPVPAAVWFMGSALLGLAGFGRRQKS